jgi:hypothetical protein
MSPPRELISSKPISFTDDEKIKHEQHKRLLKNDSRPLKMNQFSLLFHSSNTANIAARENSEARLKPVT